MRQAGIILQWENVWRKKSLTKKSLTFCPNVKLVKLFLRQTISGIQCSLFNAYWETQQLYLEVLLFKHKLWFIHLTCCLKDRQFSATCRSLRMKITWLLFQLSLFQMNRQEWTHHACLTERNIENSVAPPVVGFIGGISNHRLLGGLSTKDKNIV